MAGGNSQRRSMADYAVATHAQGASEADRRMERYRNAGRRGSDRVVWPGAAFIIEALLLLVFLAGSLAVLMQLNADASNAGRRSADLASAITMATNAAEEFAADPIAFEEAYEANPLDSRWLSQPVDQVENGSDILCIECVFATSETDAGTLHNVELQVWKNRVLTDPVQMAAEGYQSDGAIFQCWESEPLFTLETTRYVSDGEVS